MIEVLTLCNKSCNLDMLKSQKMIKILCRYYTDYILWGQRLLESHIGKEQFFSCLTMHYFSGVLPKWVLLHQMEISCHIFKLALFSKFFGDLMSHIIREYADEEMKHFLHTLPLKIMGIFLSVFLVSSLYLRLTNISSFKVSFIRLNWKVIKLIVWNCRSQF